MRVFTDQAYNLILLAEDEARMLGRSEVEPEHLLLALARRGNVARLLAEQGISAGNVHSAILGVEGLGDELVLGRVPWSSSTRVALERAIAAAAERGVRGPSSEHVLLGLGTTPSAASLLRRIGIADVEDVVDARYPTRDRPLTPERLRSDLLDTSFGYSPPQPGPGPPVFERFTDEAERAVRAAVECAALLEHATVAPFHLLLGCLHVRDGVAADVLSRQLPESRLGTIGEAMERARMYGPAPAHQATGIFTDAARQILSHGALKHAYRSGHAEIGTGHILLAIIDTADSTAERIIGDGPMGDGPLTDRVGREVAQAIPGDEKRRRPVDHRLIQLDVVIRTLGAEFAQILPPGWTLTAAPRSGGIRLHGPDSQSEEDVRIDLDWIVGQDGSALNRLGQMLLAALQALQACVVTHSGQPWPVPSNDGAPGIAAPGTEIVGTDDNPQIRVFYGDRDHPVLEVPQRRPFALSHLLNSY